MEHKAYPEKLSVMLNSELRAKLAVERTCMVMAAGRPVSQSAVVVSILHRALAATPSASVMALLDEATAAPLPGGKAAVVHLPGAQPLIVTGSTASDWAHLVFPDLPDDQTAIVAAKLLEIAQPYLAPHS